METIPREALVTERLRLEPIGRGHLDGVWAATEASLPELRPWMVWALDASRAATSAFVTSAEIEWEAGREYAFAIVEDDEIVGGVGLHTPSQLREAGEIGYWIRSDRVGRGLATEAARAIVAFGFDVIGLYRLEINAGVGNVASRRIAEKLGFQPEGVRRGISRGEDGPYDGYTFGLLATDPRP